MGPPMAGRCAAARCRLFVTVAVALALMCSGVGANHMPPVGHEDSTDDVHHLEVLQQPSNTTGGVPFAQQPIIIAVNEEGRRLNFSGPVVSAAIFRNPSGFGFVQGSDFATTPFNHGYANFTDLYINLAGDAYTLRFTALDMWVDSIVFNVSMGPPAKIAIAVQPGSAFGGEEFRPQPAVEIQDAGGNPYTLAGVNAQCWVEILRDPSGHATLSQPGLNRDPDHPWHEVSMFPLHARAVDGRMTFQRLTIDAAGVGYQLRFRTNAQALFGIYPDYIDSENFTVGIGPTAFLQVQDQPGGALGGTEFASQPTIVLKDAGGNVNIHDSHSTVTVSIEINPSYATLFPQYLRYVMNYTGNVTQGSEFVPVTFDPEPTLREAELIEIGEPVIHITEYEALTIYPPPVQIRIIPWSTDRIRLQEEWPYATAYNQTITRLELGLTRPVRQGVANFTDLRIDKIGDGYKLRFTSSLNPDLYVLSDEFNVELGPPAQLVMLRNSGDAWAGGHPFGVQPVVAVEDPGGNICDTLDNIVVQVKIKENTGNATLLGNQTALTVLGIAEFVDLELDFRGEDYVLEYNTTAGPMKVREVVDVAYSTEFMVDPTDAFPNDEFGKAVDVFDDVIVVGSSSDDRLVREVQKVSTSGTAVHDLDEIQVVTTTAQRLPEIQLLKSWADPGETIGGHFRLFYNDTEPTDWLVHDAYPELMKVHLENDLPTKQMGEVTVTRSVNTECDCEGAYVWSVTFLNLEGNIPKLTADWSMLTGAAVNMTVEVLQPSTVIGGTFTLSIRNYTTEALKWDCTHSTMARALMEIGAGTVSVNRYGPNKQLGYIWDVTFKAAHDNYDVPEMVPNGTLLTGNGAEITVHTRQNGESRLHGSFQLYFRDVGPTVPIPFNANETTMIAALEDLISVDDVWVTRSGPFADRGYTWTITFSQVRHYTTEGFAMDPVTVNLPAIVPMDSSLKPYIWRNQDEPVIKGMLTGTGAQVTVFSWTGSPEHEPFHKLARGKVGEAAGSVYILKREGERWIQRQKLRAEDTDDFDKFGDSVSIYNDTFVVGAPSAGDPGVLEIQRLICSAVNGTFTLSWRTHVTAAIPWNADADELKAYLEALYPIQEVTVDTSLNSFDQVCHPNGHVTLITFQFPQEGNLEELVPDGTLLGNLTHGASLVVQEYQRGTRDTAGVGSSDAVTGAIYTFDWHPEIGWDGMWTQSQKLMPLMEHRNLGGQFGHAVAIHEDTIVVGGPEAFVGDRNAGAAWVFTRVDGVWSHSQRLVAEPAGSKFDKFGHSVAIHGDTIVIGAIGVDNGAGKVYIYKRVSGLSSPFLSDQKIVSPNSGVLDTPIRFGFDVDIDVHTLVIGAPNDHDANNKATGLAYAYDRPSFGVKFDLRNTLRPTPTVGLDRVGHTVEVSGNTVAVGSYESTLGALTARREVQMVRTQASRGTTIGNFFYLGLRHKEVDGQWVDLWSRPIESDALASTVRAIIMEDLRTGEIKVTRSAPTAEGAYRWFVTFQTTTDPDKLPKLASKHELTGTNARVDVTVVNRAQYDLRSAVYIYTRDAADGLSGEWSEQAVLSPYAPQSRDNFGSSMSMYDSTVVVGASNRDTFVSGVNSGAVFSFDLAFLNVRFAELEQEVEEGQNTHTFELLRCNPDCRVPPTPPRNEFSIEEQLIQYSTYNGDNWGVYTFVPPYGNAARINRAPAYGRWDCRHFSAGTHDCKWTPSDGDAFKLSAFDFAAESDFSPHATEVNATGANTELSVYITDDTILEVPDETLHLRLWSPGMQPTFGGDLWATLTIIDNGDGGVGARTYYDKLYADEEDPPAGARFGSSIEVNGTHAVTGAPTEWVNNTRNAGAAYVLNQAMGVWDVEAKLVAPTAGENDKFGSGVDISENWVVVAAVGGPYVCFFHRNGSLNATSETFWTLTDTLVPTLGAGARSVTAYHQFGALHAVAIEGDVAAVGARNLETVFIYRYFDDRWNQSMILRASDYRQVDWLTTTHVFPAHFGASVSLNRNSLVVGSPRANYGNISDPTSWTDIEKIEPHISYYGTGAVYVYYLNRTVDVGQVRDRTNSFDHLLYWPAADEIVANGGDPHISFDSAGGVWSEHDKLVAPDGRAADRFGEDVALDGHHLLVGAYGSPAQPTTTWDFEHGDLRGWRMTGKAFMDQPTFMDNTAHRGVYESVYGPNPPQPSGFRGRYWVGTYEFRPANRSYEDPSVAPWHYPGTVKGDGPQGTLSSEPFIIAGDTISALVGGGCNIRVVYVELLVDNVPTVRATGECKETMRRIYWDVSAYRHRVGQIRIVDKSSAGWGHINVDDFRFDWAMQAYTETPLSGAAYAFRRRSATSEEPCEYMYNPMRCVWESQGRLVAGDKRPGVRFGYSVDLDDRSGTAIVGAYLHDDVYEDWTNPGSAVGVRIGLDGLGQSMRADGGVNNGDVGGLGRSIYGPSGSPHLRNTGSSAGGYANSGAEGWDGRGAGNKLGGSGRSSPGRGAGTGDMFASRGTWDGRSSNLPFDQGNPFNVLSFIDDPQTGLVAHPERRNQGGAHPNTHVGARPRSTGVVYIYRRRPEERAALEVLLMEPLWHIEQHSQLLVENTREGDLFGRDVAINGFTALVGAPGDSTIEDSAGSVSAFDVEYQRIRFEKEEYSVMENVGTFQVHGRIAIRVVREGDLSGYLDVEYSTRDITAHGMNQTKALECFALARHQRNLAQCGDYTQTHGVLHFLPTEDYQDFVVHINDDTCREEEEERFLVQLSLPGGVPIRGEGYSATVRIDDNDFDQEKCVYPVAPVSHPLTCIHTTYQTTATCDVHTGKSP